MPLYETRIQHFRAPNAFVFLWPCCYWAPVETHSRPGPEHHQRGRGGCFAVSEGPFVVARERPRGNLDRPAKSLGAASCGVGADRRPGQGRGGFSGRFHHARLALAGQCLSGIKVANRGIGGDTTRGVLYRLQADVLDLDPKAIVLLIGTNDIGNGAKPEDVADNIEAILQEIKRFNPHLPVVVCEVMPEAIAGNIPPTGLKSSTRWWRRRSKMTPNSRCATRGAFTPIKNGDCPRDEFPDLLHPNAVGYEKWEAELKPIFAKLNLETKAP